MPLKFDNILRFSAIHVLESLPKHEYDTGTRLVERTLVPISSRKGYPGITLANPSGRDEFFGHLERIANHVERSKLKPIVHIEAHGDESGLQLASGETVTWEELRQLLTRINIAAGLNVLVVMAMCRGWHLSRLLLPMFPAPAWAILGPTTDVPAGGLLEAMENFYGRLLQQEDAVAALKAMNEQKTRGSWIYEIEFAAHMFCESYRRYLKLYTSPKSLSAQEDFVVESLRAKWEGAGIPESEVRAFARSAMQDQRSFFEESKKDFFMFDLYPENRARFPFNAGDCGHID